MFSVRFIGGQVTATYKQGYKNTDQTTIVSTSYTIVLGVMTIIFFATLVIGVAAIVITSGFKIFLILSNALQTGVPLLPKREDGLLNIDANPTHNSKNYNLSFDLT